MPACETALGQTGRGHGAPRRLLIDNSSGAHSDTESRAVPLSGEVVISPSSLETSTPTSKQASQQPARWESQRLSCSTVMPISYVRASLSKFTLLTRHQFADEYLRDKVSGGRRAAIELYDRIFDLLAPKVSDGEPRIFVQIFMCVASED